MAPGQDAEDELSALESWPDLVADAAEHLGLDAEEDDVGPLDRLHVRRHGPDPVLPLEVLAPLLAGMACDDLTRLDETATQDAGDHRLRHHAGADRRDP